MMDTTVFNTLLTKAKMALRITTNVFDEEISDILEAGYLDMQTRGVLVAEKASDPMVVRALITYVRLHFGEPESPDRLKASYENQLGQLMTTTGYTNWGNA